MPIFLRGDHKMNNKQAATKLLVLSALESPGGDIDAVVAHNWYVETFPLVPNLAEAYLEALELLKRASETLADEFTCTISDVAIDQFLAQQESEEK